MKSERLKILIQKYWDGESTLQEEDELKSFFTSKDAQEKYPSEAALFGYFREQSQSTLNLSESEKMLSELKKTPGKQPRVIKLFWDSLKVAAVIIVVVTAGWLVNNEMRGRTSIDATADTYENPEEAYQETKRALEMLSKNLLKGREQASKIKVFNEAQEKAKTLMNEKEEEKL